MAKSDTATAPSRASRAKKWLRRLAKLGLVGVIAMCGLWIAIHRIPGLGPALADGVRSVVGPAPVAWAEDVAYGVQDYINRWRYKDAEPKTFWETPPGLASAVRDIETQSAEEQAERDRFKPKPFTAPFADVATPVDGVWLPIADPQAPKASPVMFKSMVHPDKRRSFTALAVVAIDTRALELHLVAGTREPFSNKVKREDRPGLIPKADSARLFAAFNGGFKATHGHYGMMLNDVEYLAPRDIACTFVRYRDGSFGIGTWSSIKGDKVKMLFYRQTPPCLVEAGTVHKTLGYNEYAKTWGATVSGETVIRRSAIGLDAERKVIFYGLGEAMTARAMADGMKAAGAHWVAELDVNHSYPRFLFYEHSDDGKPPKATSAIIPGIDYTSDQYVTRPSVRDFFYLTRESAKAGAQAADPRSKFAVK